jgi:hypothetical protein
MYHNFNFEFSILVLIIILFQEDTTPACIGFVLQMYDIKNSRSVESVLCR